MKTRRIECKQTQHGSAPLLRACRALRNAHRCAAIALGVLGGCAQTGSADGGVEKADAFAKDFCHVDPIVGQTKESSVNIEVHIDWIKKLEATGKLDRIESSKIQQELSDYSASAQSLDRSLEQACRYYALCYYKNQSEAACSVEYEDEQKKEAAARAFYLQSLSALKAIDDKFGKPPQPKDGGGAAPPTQRE